MKKILFSFITFFALTQAVSSQEKAANSGKYTTHNKGKFFVAFGGNRDTYTKSDIHFKGENFNFTVSNAEAHDKPKGWHVDYINPARFTIPQTNMKFGYFLNDHYAIALNIDHMKYIFLQNQTANVTGTINLPASDPGSVYNGTYNNTPVDFTDGTFLQFEHTNGLNYVHPEISRFDDLSKLFGITNTDKFQINITEGIGAGFLYPRTDAIVLSKEDHDKFHIAGYGLSAKAGLNFTFFKYFFLQTELKGGYINMPDIEITYNNSEKASQHFMFFESIIYFGGIFKI
ncbi:hypothetical protein [Flavobacterium sp.]|uniref:hypothetical protein n=1 Tax=Flavobacterium sp. TaxID=239 RepID=UPI0025FC9EAF|nr:hypothetical protein [Flavobacterium sp.]